MNTKQKIHLSSEEVVGLDFTDCVYVRLSCGSEITIDSALIERLLAIKEVNNKLPPEKVIVSNGCHDCYFASMITMHQSQCYAMNKIVTDAEK